MMKKLNRGFATMNPEKQREIAIKGGLAVSANKEHMSIIGRCGGLQSGFNRRKRMFTLKQT